MAPNFPAWKRRVPQPKLGVDVVTTNISQNPPCPHGPSICFEQFFTGGKSRKFYACSAHRDRKSCPFFFWADQCPSKKAREEWAQRIRDNKPTRSHQDEYRRLAGIRALAPEERGYCTVCCTLCELPSDPHHPPTPLCGALTVLTPLTDPQLAAPSQLLPLQTANKSLAQYVFTSRSLAMVKDLVLQTGCEKVLCLGVPSLHEVLKKGTSMLLDMDHRYRSFFSPKEFVRFNMFNQHFFDGDLAKKRLSKFLACEGDVAVVCDPPFGCRLELLAVAVAWLELAWRQANGVKDGSRGLKVILLLPYFLAAKVEAALPKLHMLDYQFAYQNHAAYTEAGPRAMKHGSAVRAYTSLPPRRYRLPASEGYRKCEPCQRWVYAAQVHCGVCGCAGKDGSAYVHCGTCGTCVKGTWQHCDTCGTCKPEHTCLKLPALSLKEAQKGQAKGRCHVCGDAGHRRGDCPVKQSKKEDSSRKRRKKEKPASVGDATECFNIINELLGK